MDNTHEFPTATQRKIHMDSKKTEVWKMMFLLNLDRIWWFLGSMIIFQGWSVEEMLKIEEFDSNALGVAKNLPKICSSQ